MGRGGSCQLSERKEVVDAGLRRHDGARLLGRGRDGAGCQWAVVSCRLSESKEGVDGRFRGHDGGTDN